MRAMICNQYGIEFPLSLTEIPEPEPGRGQVKIRVRAAGVSFADTLMMQNRHQNKHQLPFAPGMEVAGEIVATGGDVTGLNIGQRVMALVYDGGYADYAIAEKADVFPLPGALDDASAVALGSTYLTSHASLRWTAQVTAGETVLILGASGGVGLAAVEICKEIGARVIACASSTEKLAIARKHGADSIINYAEEEIKDRVAALKPEGVDVIFDPVGGDLADAALSALDWGGRYLIIGFAAGKIPAFPANRLLVKNRAVLGFVLMYFRRRQIEQLHASWKELLDWFLDGRIRPHIFHTLPLDQANRAIEMVHGRSVIGKIVLSVAK